MKPPALLTILWVPAVLMCAGERVPSTAPNPISSPTSIVRTKQFLSPVYTIDRKYRSEEGPWSNQKLTLWESTPPELLWITGIRTEMVGSDGATPTLPEFMCHVSLNFENLETHQANFGWGKQGGARILALSQGQTSDSFPPGFGIPILSNEMLVLTTRVLNHNRIGERFEVRHRVTVEFVRDREVRAPMSMKALRNLVGHVLVPIDRSESSGSGSMSMHHHAEDGDGDEAGEPAPTSVGRIFQDGSGEKLIGHWVVPPGRQIRKKNVTDRLQVPFDTTLHFAAVHMHPFAESLELRDLTTGKSLVKCLTRPLAKGIGLEHVDSFSSEEGIPIYKDHQYQLISVYNNTSPVNQDSMAVMYLFVLDSRFHKPTSGAVASARPAN